MVQSIRNRFVEIGRIGRPRGLEGVVRFMPNHNFADDLFDRADLFYMKNERTDLVPSRIESVHVETKRNQQTFFVKFDMIANRTDAETAQNKAVFIKADLFDEVVEPEENDEESFFGYIIKYDGEEFGKVLDVLKNPAHPILEVKHGSGTILIPMVDEYIDDTDHENGIISCINLDQLTES
ncbi:ribosome maturation factor RimM [Rhodohalobacter sulfatireducens]|uniref:Ribosome maturation factor RimM n=1 Tax=Rhodohalobacter sulfatireducens TaxID=2911366 RepID=A0ABS9K8T7_9BACT|nr:ribosome maturation factor RimM [Rhodohalobacter sulfatireducens]MCG2587227.1 ribosome maturation factor RimM [Rhodohalobacter sulfatireducens]